MKFDNRSETPKILYKQPLSETAPPPGADSTTTPASGSTNPTNASPQTPEAAGQAQLDALKAKRRAFDEDTAAKRRELDAEEARMREQYFLRLDAEIDQRIKAQLDEGANPASILKSIAKRNNLPLPAKSSTPKKAETNPTSAPKTFDAWVTKFAAAAKTAYTKTHKIPVEQIPPDELRAIEEQARTKAAAKCQPATPPQAA
jgi:hypothetical protein